MNFKTKLKLIFLYFSVFISVTFSVVTVFGTDIVFEASISDKEVLSKNIYLDDRNLQTNYVIYDSDFNLSNYKVSSSCKISSKFIGNKDNRYIFKFTYLENCFSSKIYLKSDKDLVLKNSQINLNLFSKSRLFDYFVDNNNESLLKIQENIRENKERVIEKLNDNKELSSIDIIKLKRQFLEFNYQSKFLNDILEKREEKYLVPVSGYNLPTKLNKIPNAKRPYRSKYTDGIHHSWDIDTKLGEEIIALDSGKIVRVVNNWKWSDFAKLKYTNLSYEDKLKNLDILRGNQIWLKTSKGDIVFYGHLDKVYDNIKKGVIVSKGEKLGTIGISGVPDKNYTDYHLDFSVSKNPYIKKKVGKYSFMDYMKWDWYFKGKDSSFILKNQYNVFETNI